MLERLALQPRSRALSATLLDNVSTLRELDRQRRMLQEAAEAVAQSEPDSNQEPEVTSQQPRPDDDQHDTGIAYPFPDVRLGEVKHGL